VQHPTTVVDPEQLLGELSNAGVEFIVVGGMAALIRDR